MYVCVVNAMEWIEHTKIWKDIPILLGSALIKGGLPSPFSMQQWRIPLINQGNYRLFLDECSVALKTDQGFHTNTKGKLAQVTQLQAIEESFKHLKISEILEFLFNNQRAFTMHESSIYKPRH